MEKNQIFENIMSRTSVRSYTEKPVEQEKVEMMLRAGMAAPSACSCSLTAIALGMNSSTENNKPQIRNRPHKMTQRSKR